MLSSVCWWASSSPCSVSGGKLSNDSIGRDVAGKGGRHESGADFSLHFPSFMWLVRDFSLQLLSPEGKPISAKDYLELALKETPGFNEQIESKNRYFEPLNLER